MSKAWWLYSGPLRSEQSQGWYVPVMDKDGTLKLFNKIRREDTQCIQYGEEAQQR